MRGRATVLLKTNSKTTHSYAHLSMPVRFINRALQKSLCFKEDLCIVAEIVPDGQFQGANTTTAGIRYGVNYEGTCPHVTIPESDQKGFLKACVAALADIYLWYGADRMSPEKICTTLELALQAELDAVRRSQPAHGPTGSETLEEQRQVTLRPAGSGVKVVFFTLVVKTASLALKYPGGVQGFLAAFPDTNWESDGLLLGTSAMTDEDLIPIIEGLTRHGPQAKVAPVDFYVLEDCRWDRMPPPVLFLTHDDNELEWIVKQGDLYVHLT